MGAPVAAVKPILASIRAIIYAGKCGKSSWKDQDIDVIFHVATTYCIYVSISGDIEFRRGARFIMNRFQRDGGQINTDLRTKRSIRAARREIHRNRDKAER